MPSIRIISALAVACLAGCDGAIFPGGKNVLSPNGGGPSGTGGSGGGSDFVAPIVVTPAAPQVRVLSATEYRNTVRELLGLPISTHFTQSDWTAGFDNGADIHVDDNLLAALADESERLATEYLKTQGRTDFPCFDPANVADACVQTIIERVGRRAHRRPLSSEQRAELFAFFRTVSTAVGSKVTGAEMVIARLLTSAQFLYRSEVGRPTTPGGDTYALDDFEKASLLSYTLTGSMPDEPLLADAEAGLLDEAHLRQHIQRLWRSPKSKARVGDFFRQWLKVTRLDEMAQRPAAYPKLTTTALGASLKAEFDAYVAAVVFDGAGTLPALFTESYTVGDSNVAALYGRTVSGTTPQTFPLDPAQRRGVLTLASTMAAIASADDPSQDRPVVRGLMVKEQLLCEEVGPPSGISILAAANTAMSQTPNFHQLTTREQYEAMMQQGAVCASCHRQFMPLGFALSRYDALGRYRTEQRGRPVNEAVVDVPFAGTDRGFTGATDLAQSLANSPATASCFSKNFVRFTTGGHGEDAETLGGSVFQKLGKGPLVFAKLVEETLASPHLYLRKGVPFVPATGGTGGGGGGAGGGGGTGGGAGGGSGAVTTSVLLASGATLNPDQTVTSADGAYRLHYQLDGNLVLYRVGGGALWASNTPGSSVGRTAMQGDGNLVVYDRDNAPKFHTSTHGNPGAQLRIDTNGKLTIVAPNGTELRNLGGTP